ncbi:MFS transporter [Actinorhabdospora filicis]|uniref:MFS transporter n=1 Tax=Actinorhabdospora filicis TaxID=1785913 RepID=A0A9W6WD08_9ACTN|nr:MFS transporter [Actinorhabdospora filicis]GLZ81126.1 MFS transporter [Actinorhabdospora filicis]
MHTEGHLRAVFRESGFRRLLATRLTSQIADGFFQAGLASSILFNPNNRTNAISVALGFALLLIPYSVLGPYVGVFLDRWSRRNVLFKANILRAVLVVPTALLIATDSNQWLYAVGALLVIAVNRFVLSGLSASQPHVVTPENLVTANSIAPTLGTIAYTTGLGVAASMRLLIGNSTADNGLISAIAIIGYIAAGLIARSSFTVDALGPDASERHADRSIGAEIASITRGMAAGAKHLWSRRGAAYMLLTQGAYRALYGVLTIATLQLFRVYFDAGDEDKKAIAALAAVVVVGSAGGFIGAMITPYLTRRFGPRAWVIVILVLVAVDIAVFGPPFSQPLLIAATFVLNIGSQSLKIVVDTSVQLRVDDNYRGRVFSVNDTFFNVCWVLGLLAGAVLLPEDGHSLAMIVAIAGGYLLLAAGYALASRRHTPYDRPSWTTN